VLTTEIFMPKHTAQTNYAIISCVFCSIHSGWHGESMFCPKDSHSNHPKKVPSKYWVLNGQGRNSKKNTTNAAHMATSPVRSIVSQISL